MNVEVVKNMDPFNAHLLLLLERIATSLEKLVDLDDDHS
jgi:hypothetical protein